MTEGNEVGGVNEVLDHKDLVNKLKSKKPKYLTNKQFNQRVIDEVKGKIPIHDLTSIKQHEKIVLAATDKIFNMIFKEKKLNQLSAFMKQTNIVEKQKA